MNAFNNCSNEAESIKNHLLNVICIVFSIRKNPNLQMFLYS